MITRSRLLLHSLKCPRAYSLKIKDSPKLRSFFLPDEWACSYLFISFIYLFVFYFHLVVFSPYRSIISNIFWCSNYFINCNMFIICLKSYKLAREYQFVKKDKLYLMIWTGHGCWRKWWETPSIKIPSVCSRKIFQPRFCYVWVFMFESVRFERCRSFWTLHLLYPLLASFHRLFFLQIFNEDQLRWVLG